MLPYFESCMFSAGACLRKEFKNILEQYGGCKLPGTQLDYFIDNMVPLT